MRTSLIFLVVGGIIFWGCERNKDCAECPQEYISDYNFYIMDGERGQYVFVYNTAQQKIVDSVYTDGHEYDNIEVSADERYLFLSQSPSDTYVYDLQTLEEIKHFDFGGTLEVSPDGRYLAVQADRFHLLDISTLEVAFVDSIGIINGNFGLSGESFIGGIPDSGLRVVWMGDSVWAEPADFPPYLHPIWGRVIPSSDSGQAYVLASTEGALSRYIELYDLSTLENRYIYALGSYDSDMRLADSGRTLIVTDPLSYNAYNSYMTASVYIFDASSLELKSIIPPMDQKYSPDGFEGPLNPGEIAVTPDNQFAIVGSGPLATPYFGIISLPDHKYVKYDSLGIPEVDFGIPTSVACRKFVKEAN